MSNYNPYSEAFRALTSDRAIAFYSIRAQADTQMVLDSALTVGIGIYQLCSFVYALGVMTGEAHYSAVSKVTTASVSAQPCFPTPKAIAALPAVKDRKYNSTEEIANEVLVTTAPVTRLLESLTDTDDFRHEIYLKLTKRQLIERCAARGLQPKKSMTKRQLAELLTQSYSSIKPHQFKSCSGRVVSIA